MVAALDPPLLPVAVEGPPVVLALSRLVFVWLRELLTVVGPAIASDTALMPLSSDLVLSGVIDRHIARDRNRGGNQNASLSFVWPASSPEPTSVCDWLIWPPAPVVERYSRLSELGLLFV